MLIAIEDEDVENIEIEHEHEREHSGANGIIDNSEMGGTGYHEDLEDELYDTSDGTSDRYDNSDVDDEEFMDDLCDL